MEASPELPSAPDGWSRGERALLVGLVLVLLALFAIRVQTRRIDSSRLPPRPDVLVLHMDELRADAVPTASLAADLGLAADELLVFSQAFAQSSDGRRSALSALRGDFVLNLEGPPGPESLPAVLGAHGWSTVLLAPPSLAVAAGSAFGSVSSVDRDALPDALAESIRSEGGPIFAFVHVPAAGPPLHGQTTDARALQAAYRARVTDLRGLVSRLAQAFTRRDRPQLVVLMGGSGAELGEHPEEPERLHDTLLRVPWIIGLRHGRGLPYGEYATLVQSADLAPTVLDFVDLRSSAQRASDGLARDGRSLEPLCHGWTVPPVHEQLFLAGPGEVAVRTVGWKLAASVDEPWRLRRFDVRLHALAEDPGERTDLAGGRDLGPRGRELLEALEERLARPETLAVVR